MKEKDNVISIQEPQLIISSDPNAIRPIVASEKKERKKIKIQEIRRLRRRRMSSQSFPYNLAETLFVCVPYNDLLAPGLQEKKEERSRFFFFFPQTQSLPFIVVVV